MLSTNLQVAIATKHRPTYRMCVGRKLRGRFLKLLRLFFHLTELLSTLERLQPQALHLWRHAARRPTEGLKSLPGGGRDRPGGHTSWGCAAILPDCNESREQLSGGVPGSRCHSEHHIFYDDGTQPAFFSVRMIEIYAKKHCYGEF